MLNYELVYRVSKFIDIVCNLLDHFFDTLPSLIFLVIIWAIIGIPTGIAFKEAMGI